MTSFQNQIIFKEPSKTKKNDIFYWTKKNINISSQILDHFANDNDFILDPFMGSGTNLYGSVLSKNSINFIGVEINEMPFKNLITNISLNRDKLISLKEKIKFFEERYKYLYTYSLTGMKEEVILEKAHVDIINSKIYPKEFFIHLENSEHKLKISKNENSQYFDELLNLYTKKNYKQIDLSKLENYSLIENSRIAINKNLRISDLFSPVNYLILIEFKNFSKNNNDLKFLLSQVLQLCKFTDKKSQSQFIFWFPKKYAVDRNVIKTLKRRLLSIEKKVLSNKESLENLICTKFDDLETNNQSLFLINKPFQSVNNKEIPDQSIDLVFTDPPYYDQIPFSEYLELWKFFLSYENNLSKEVVQSNRKEKSMNRDKYLKNLYLVFKNVSKKLKEKKYALVYFKDTNFINLRDFILTLSKCNLYFKDIIHVPRNIKTYKQNNSSESTLTGESIFIFQKLVAKKSLFSKDINQMNDENYINDFIEKFLVSNDKPSLSRLLDDGLLKILIKKDALKQIKNINQLKKIIKKKYYIDKNNRIS